MAGRWFGDWNGRMQTMDIAQLADGALEVAMFDGFRATLNQVGESQFSAIGHESVVLSLAEDKVTANDEGKTIAVLQRIPHDEPRATPIEVAGFYTSPALNHGVWTLQWQEGELVATSPRGTSAPMPPLFGNVVGSNNTGLFMEFDDGGLILRAGQVPPIRMTRTDIRPAIAELSKAIETQGANAAWASYRDMRKTVERYDFSEAALNAYGYQLLQRQRPRDAVEIFKMMVDSHPESLNALDSLADGQKASGEREAAITTYERILAMQPNQGAVRQALQQLRDAGSGPNQ